MTITSIIKLVSVIICFVITVAAFVIALVHFIKRYKSATTDAEKAEAINEMISELKEYVTDAEAAYENLTAGIASSVSGGTVTTSSIKTGALKKDKVLSNLQSYAIANGYEFDRAYWSEEIDSLIKVTNSVNSDEDESETATATNTTAAAATSIKK